MKKLSEIFNWWYGVNLELINCEVSHNGIPFVSRTAANNGVVARVSPVEGIVPNPSHTLSLAGGGSVLSCFYQDEPYYSGRDLFVLSPKVEMSKNEMILYSYIISTNKYKYNYGRQANKTYQDLMLPELHEIKLIVETSLNADYKFNQQALMSSVNSLNLANWDWFVVEDLFNYFERGKVHSQYSLPSGDDYFYVGAKKDSQGVMSKCGYDEGLVSKGNCVIFICNGEGSVGYSNYMDRDFLASGDLILGYGDKINKYTGLFLSTILDRERPKYSFGRKYGKYVKQTAIMLPSTEDGKPDWEFMENYIKSLPYSANI